MPHEGTFQLQTDVPSLCCSLVTKSVWKLGENFKTKGYDLNTLPVLFKVWFLQNSKISTPTIRKSWLDLSQYSPGVGIFLSRGPCFGRKILPRGRVFDHFKKFPQGSSRGGCWCLELTDALFHILIIKSSNRVDGALFNFLFYSFENSLIGHSLFCS